MLYTIVDSYSKEEVKAAKKEHRKAELFPKTSAQIMGHTHIDVTMEVYNHLGDRARIETGIAKLDSIAVNF